ncbi:hypothetical protein ALC62_02477 [Cyphomyrmex costatus]|uniref:Uncharacterized protein n=1 Tax=Cyphomyrmex costatus TaxID=456900 RepID=A0A151IN24_9HYME|nr:hypothetical protein ALC62_02477 [Cyphomyrmex costatus]
MSERHYRRLKSNAYNIAIAANNDKQSIHTDNDDVSQSFSYCDVNANLVTNIDHDLEATNCTLRNELSQQDINIFDIHNENTVYDFDSDNSYIFANPSCSTALTFNNEKSINHASSFTTLSIKDNLTNWAVQYQISHTAVTALLQILRKNFNLPKNCKTLLKTPINTNIRKVAPGEYFHCGLKSGIMEFLQKSRNDVDLVEVQICIDGLTISKSSTNQLWPILSSVAPTFDKIFIIGCYFGPKKPYDCNEFLREFVNEAKILRKFIGLNNLYTVPCNSSLLGIYMSKEYGQLSAWPLTFVKMKYVKINSCNSTFVLLPLLHTERM